jgi:hypothetical protein
VDQDQDGLSDYCELQLARSFAPMLHFAGDEQCGGGEGYWAAKAIDSYFTGTPEQVKLGYLMAHYDDCGSFGHYGDSEFIQVTIEYNPATQHWSVIGGWLSAHSCMDNSLECIAGTGATENTSYGAGFEYPSGRSLSFPRVYISMNKHANYHTGSDCENGGAFWTDTCAGGTDAGRFKVWQDHNIGSGHHPLIDCVQSQAGNPALTGTECFWSGSQFAGWHANVEGTSGYSNELLSLVAFQATMVTYNWWWIGSYGL